MSWTAVVPVKTAAARKTRLAPLLAPEARMRLAERMLAHVLGTLAETPAIATLPAA